MKKNNIQNSPTTRRRKELNCYSDQSNPKYALLQQSLTSSPCSGWFWLPLHRNKRRCKGFVWISQTPIILLQPHCLQRVYSEFTLLRGARIGPLISLLPRSTKLGRTKSLLQGVNVDKEKLHRDGDLLPAWVCMAVSEVRDLLGDLCWPDLWSRLCYRSLHMPAAKFLCSAERRKTQTPSAQSGKQGQSQVSPPPRGKIPIACCNHSSDSLQLLHFFLWCAVQLFPQTILACPCCIFKIK